MQWDGINRRRFVRVQYPFTVHIYVPGEPPISSYTEDISTGGIKVTIKQVIAKSTLVDLEIYLKSDPVLCKGVVSWARERKSKFLEDTIIHDLGIEFSEVKTGDKRSIKKQVDDLAKAKKEDNQATE
ncbi:MAG: PilZ domain-containing protein [Candidatus Omnitrophica bacterium]|nr:PilZ domain-containing protein [Candidatus Omnitrophota bacterium]